MKYILIVASLFLFVGCGTNNNPDSSPNAETTASTTKPTDEIAFDGEITKVRPVYREAETILTNLIHTRLQVEFDWSKSQLIGIAWITAKPHFYSSDSLILDAKGMDINSVSMGSKSLAYTYKDDFLRIHLGKTYTKTDTFTVMVDYVAKPDEYDAKGSAAISDAKGLYFINPKGEDKTKMPQIWTQGETESSSVWFPTIDAPNAKTSQEIFITVDDKYTTLSNGKLVSSKKIDGGKRVDHWKQELQHAPYLFMMGVGEFKVVEDSYTRPDGTKMAVNYYVEPEWEEFAKDIFGETPEMIRFFSDLLGVEYPWDKYHQIVVRDYVSGAMENTGAVIFGDFVYANKRELLDGNSHSIIAHELFHHWFGDLVTTESWSNLTLNESFANYSQYLWDEHHYGLDEADYQAEGEADGYYQSAQTQGHHNLVWFDYDDKEQMFDGHSYNKGGRILHMLRNYIGDEAFFEALKRYLKENQFKAAEFHHLRLTFEEVTGEDLNWFFNQWYQDKGHPVLTFGHAVAADGKSVTIAVEQTQSLDEFPIFKLPTQIAIFDDAGKHVHKVVIDQVKQEFTLPLSGTLKGIHFDDQHMLLAKIKDDKTTEQLIFQYYNGERFASRRDGFVGGLKDKGEAGQQLILDALKDPFWHIRLLVAGKVSRLSGSNLETGLTIVQDMVKNDPNSAVRSVALGVLAKELSENKLVDIYSDRILKDSSYTVVSAALKNYGKINPTEAMTLAEPLENEKSSKMLGGIGQLYAGYAKEEKINFFVNAFEGNIVQGFERLGLLNSFTVYLTRQDPAVIEKSISTYTKLNEEGGLYMKMFLPQNLKYLIEQLQGSITTLNREIETHESNGDVVLADQARKKIKSYEALIEKFSAIKE